MNARDNALNHRMREILEQLRRSNPEIDLPLDNAEIAWNPTYLEQLGLVHHAFDLKNKNLFLDSKQPMWVVPNDERRPLAAYLSDNFMYDEEEEEADEDEEYDPITRHYNESDWEFEAILDGLEADVHFEDPYPGLKPWPQFQGQDEGQDGRDSNRGRARNGPNTVPFMGPDSDSVSFSSILAILFEQGIDNLAWYTPRGSVLSPWGIYVKRFSAAIVAESFFWEMDNRYEAWCLASRLILNHEYFHFLSQYHCDRTYTGSPRTERYLLYDQFWYDNKTAAKEEAAAHGYAYSRSAKSAEDKELSEIFLVNSPPPYTEFKKYLPPVGARAVAYQHEHRSVLPPLAYLNPTSDSVFAPTPKEKVPVYLVDFVPEGHVGPKMLTFARIVFAPRVTKRIRKGRVPPGVVKKLKALVFDLRGGIFGHVKHLESMNSKTHFVTKNLPLAWRAIWAQVENRNGWVIVFLGNHTEYERYQRVHGL
jgi:hypothetical protein